MTAIRKASLKDLDPLAQLFNEYRVFYKKEDDFEAARAFIETRIKNKDSKIFIAINEKGLMVGFTQLYPLFSSTRLKPLWLLNDLYINPIARGQGYSVGLIERAKQLCRKSGACGMMLETGIDNKIGNQLYPKTGFTLNSSSNFYSWDV